MNEGGHFAALELPHLFADELKVILLFCPIKQCMKYNISALLTVSVFDDELYYTKRKILKVMIMK